MVTPPRKIIYGTAWKKERTVPLVVQAILHGFRAIDTACQPKHYREDLVGEALSILYNNHSFKREDLFVQTKFTPISGQDRSKPLPYDPTSPIRTQILSSFSTSLSNLRTNYIDSYLLHSPFPTLTETLEAWRALIHLKDTGKVKLIGISNAYDTRLLASLSKERRVDIVQNRWYQGNGWDKQVVQFCKEVSGMEYQSFWTLTGSPTLLDHWAIKKLAEKKGLTTEQVIYAFVIMNGITPISGTTSEMHMEEDVDVQSVALGGVEEEEDLIKEVQKYVWG
ncbi:NADP-dependent oxidoreductase domain containing protein [Amanita muscaria]